MSDNTQQLQEDIQVQEDIPQYEQPQQNYRQQDNKNHGQKNNTTNVLSIIGSVFHFCIWIIALYLSFKCNNGFNILSFLVAFFLPEIYVIYIFATRGFNFCSDQGDQGDQSD